MAEKKTTTKKTTTKTTTKKTTNGAKTATKNTCTANKEQKTLFQPLFDYIKNENSKLFRREKVRCTECGHTWNCIFINIKGGEYKLECPKCKKRSSQVIYK